MTYETASSDDLLNAAKYIRKDVVDVCVKNGAGHIAPSYLAWIF